MPYGRWSMLFILTWYVADGNRRSHNGIHMNDVDRRRGIGLDQSSESTPPSLSSNCVTSVVWTELDFVRLHFPRSAELVRGMISWAFQINSTLREMSKMARHLFDRTTTWEAVHFLWRCWQKATGLAKSLSVVIHCQKHNVYTTTIRREHTRRWNEQMYPRGSHQVDKRIQMC